MPPRDKYTVFSRHEKGYRKGIHKVPKWTRVRRLHPVIVVPTANSAVQLTLRTNPKGF